MIDARNRLALPDSTASTLPSTSSNAAKLREASGTAEKILQAFPDYGRATDSYRLALVEVIASYPPAVQARMRCLRTGLAAKCRFLPTVADVVEFGDAIIAAENRPNPYAPLRSYEGLRPDPEPYRPRQVERIYDRQGNRVRPSDAIDDEAWRAGIARTQRMAMFIAELGEGDSLHGWEIAMERGITQPPDDWHPKQRSA